MKYILFSLLIAVALTNVGLVLWHCITEGNWVYLAAIPILSGFATLGAFLVISPDQPDF